MAGALGSRLCDALCFRIDTDKLNARRLASEGLLRQHGGLSSESTPHMPTRRDVLNLAWPHAHWLLLGCLALACRLPFSLAMPHFVSQVIGALINDDLPAAYHAATLFGIAGECRENTGALGINVFVEQHHQVLRSLSPGC